MPRKNRIHYRRSFHHVMLRGNNRTNIFYRQDDYESFLKMISEAADTYGFKIHLYCLMTNHIHLVIEVQDVPVSRIMQSIAGRYAKIHNVKYKKSGHLFQGRFKSKLISSDEYLLELCYYVHMNPVKAKMCEMLDDYAWSSHNNYRDQVNNSWLTTRYISDIIVSRIGKISSYDKPSVPGSVRQNLGIIKYMRAVRKPTSCQYQTKASQMQSNPVQSQAKIQY